jgi:hypothetical protein
MSSLTVKPVQTRREQKQFLELPWEIYRGDKNWVPPLRDNQKELVGYKPHPFYDDAEIQTFLALRDKRPCGRVAAIINRAHNRRYKEERGFFGFFESIDDQEVAAGLFDAARGWLAERNIHKLRGPMNPSMNYECGLLIEGFDSPPTFLMTYNPPYYPDLLERYGFCKVQDMYAYGAHLGMLGQLNQKMMFIVEEATRRFNVKCRHLNPSRFAQDVQTFLNIYNQSLGGTWGFVPLSDAEMKHMASGMQRLVVPELTCLAEVEGRDVAAIFGMLDYNPRIKQIDGRLFPFGFIRLLWNRKAIKKIRLVSTNVLPEFQRWGLALVAGHRLYVDGVAWGVSEVEFSWVLESNHLSRASIERGGALKEKSFRLYDYAPAEDAAKT